MPNCQSLLKIIRKMINYILLRKNLYGTTQAYLFQMTFYFKYVGCLTSNYLAKILRILLMSNFIPRNESFYLQLAKQMPSNAKGLKISFTNTPFF